MCLVEVYLVCNTRVTLPQSKQRLSPQTDTSNSQQLFRHSTTKIVKFHNKDCMFTVEVQKPQQWIAPPHHITQKD